MNAQTPGPGDSSAVPDDDGPAGLWGGQDVDLEADDAFADDSLAAELLADDEPLDDARADSGAVAPTVAAGGPGVVVVHDWYGALAHVAEFADELTMAGFDVELVDLYDGVTTLDAGRAEELADDLDDDSAMVLIAAAGQRLRAAGSQRVGVVGFSLGGWLALRTASGGPFDAVVAYYASATPESAARLSAPVQLHLAAVDEFESPDDVDAFVAALRAAGTPVDTFTYRGTTHSFANLDVDLADAHAAEVALARTIGFLHARLA